MSRTELVVDTDGGTDDAVALWWALADPRVEVVAILVTAGVVGRDAAATNVLRILHAAQRGDIPVALGAAAVAGDRPTAHGSDGLGGFGRRWPIGDLAPIDTPAADLLYELATTRPGELDLVTIGPSSTLAAALAADPDLPRRVRSLTAMGDPGGADATAEPDLPPPMRSPTATGGPGDTNATADTDMERRARPPTGLGGASGADATAGTDMARWVRSPTGIGGPGGADTTVDSETARWVRSPSGIGGPGGTDATVDSEMARRVGPVTGMGGGGDTNTLLDPEAAGVVGAAPWRRPARVVGVDVTLWTLLHEEDLDLAAEGRTAAARFVAKPLRAYAAECVRRGRVPAGRCPVHDLVAVIAAVDPSFVLTDERRLRQEFASLVS